MSSKDYGRGKHNFWIGEIRNINDPKKSNRCQVRIYGLEDDMEKIPDDKLRWAMCAMPVTVGSAPGSGAVHGLMQGSRVMGMFMDEDEQIPIILWTIGKTSQ